MSRFAGVGRVAPVVAFAVAGCGRVATPPVDAVYPVVSFDRRALVTDHLSSDAYVERTLSRAATGDTTERESVVTRIDEVASGSTMVRVSTGHYAGGDYYDSLFVRRSDLRPVREHLAYRQRQIDQHFDFDGDVVHQVSRVRDSVNSVERRYDVPVFAFSEIELIVRSLPFRAGYTAVLPLYSEGDGAIEMDSVSVVDVRPDRWTIRFGDPAIVAVYEVDAASRRILSYNVTNRKTGGRARKIYQAALTERDSSPANRAARAGLRVERAVVPSVRGFGVRAIAARPLAGESRLPGVLFLPRLSCDPAEVDGATESRDGARVPGIELRHSHVRERN